MQNKNLLVLSLIISGISLSPVMAEYPQVPTQQSQKSQHSLSQGLTTLLYKRGLEKNAAKKRVKALLSAEDEALLAQIMHRLEAHDLASSEAMMRYFSMAALHQEKLDFKSEETYRSMLSLLNPKASTQKLQESLRTLLHA